MKYGINELRNIPEISIERKIEINRISHILGITFGYAPDRERGESNTNLGEEDINFIEMSEEILTELDIKFLSDLYIDRLERVRVEGHIPSKRPIIVHGLSGAGKTTLILKICERFNKMEKKRCIYFDFRSIGVSFNRNSKKSFIQNFQEIIFHKLQKEFIEDSEININEWIKFKIIEDPRYSAVKELILKSWRKPLAGIEWLKLLDEEFINEEYNEIDSTPDLSFLLRYLETKQSILLCIDNADRFTIGEQRELLEKTIHLSNSTHIPIILTLRTSNLRRITKDGAKGDIVYTDRIEKLSAKTFELDKIINKDFENIENIEENEELVRETLIQVFQKRFDFIWKNRSYVNFGKYYKEIRDKFNFNYHPSEYIKEFWKIFSSINKTFVENDIYQYCNYSIREILVTYFEFINKLMIEPEENYSFNDLFPVGQIARNTDLRNYLYKWLLCGGELTPKGNEAFPNIFEYKENGTRMLTMKFLSYLYKYQKGHDGISFKKIEREFWYFGVGRAELRSVVSSLTKNQHFNGKSLVWIDLGENDNIEDGKIFILPAGEYFIEKLSTSRDYVFWMLMNKGLDERKFLDIFGETTIDYKKTYEDYFKIEKVYLFIKTVLFPNFLEEISNLDTQMLQRNKEKPIEQFERTFSISGDCYLEKLINSLLNSIIFSRFSEKDKNEMNKKFIDLLREIKIKKNQLRNGL